MSQLRTIQAARGIAANLVVFSHLFLVEAKYTAGSVLPAFTLYGVAGVDLFFVISGFIMVAVAGRDTGPIEFLWRRATRIYPTYWLVSLAVLAVAIAAPTIVNSSIQVPISLWRSFFLIPDRTLPLLAVGWTLIHEMYFYLVFAIFLALRISLPASLIGWGVLLFVIWAAVPDRVAASPILRLVTNPLTLEFIMGAFVGIQWRKRQMSGVIGAGAIGLSWLALSICYVAPVLSLTTSPHFDAWRVAMFGIPSALLVYALTGFEQLYRKARPTELLVVLGDWSYATYLVHVLVISAIGRTVVILAPAGGVNASVALIAIGLLAANIAGAGIHILFERPTINWLRKFGSRLPRPVEPAADEATR
jgi:exopolysaccharide production protein ExoZ